ncbi:MAG: rhodanese-like domain-containing protein [Pedobacter sp.]|nr:rhodanese-like domain-containing protein [Pedobacter sp.]MDQ8054076.1 rhodanese-like domain-containing protein [Pedobacter sp.]
MKNLFGIVLLALGSFFLMGSSPTTEKYRCLPCGQTCDETLWDSPGKCAKCHMELVKASTISFKHTDPASICSYIKSHPNTILLDVRTKNEFLGNAEPNFGTLKNAINIPIQELNDRMAELKAYKNKDILVYCSHSHRSPQAAYLLTQNGFAHIINMDGGMSQVTASGCKK